VALGVDLFRARLFRVSDEQTVVTTEDGSIVQSDNGPQESSLGILYLTVPEDTIDDAVLTLDNEPSILGVTLSPEHSQQRIQRYIDHVRDGSVLSQDPYVLQAPRGPSPQFDPGRLGAEIPLAPATSADVVPRVVTDRDGSDRALATEERPIVIIGTVQEPDTTPDPRTIMVWFTESGGVCQGAASEDGMGSGCGDIPLARYGITGESTGTGRDTLTYSAPLHTSVIHIITDDATYWQQPIAGYGLIPYGQTVSRPTEIIALDAQGNELGRWTPVSQAKPT
jgi:hypothetical protein